MFDIVTSRTTGYDWGILFTRIRYGKRSGGGDTIWMFKKYTLLQKVFSIFADLADVGNFAAHFDPLHSSKCNENKWIL